MTFKNELMAVLEKYQATIHSVADQNDTKTIEFAVTENDERKLVLLVDTGEDIT